MSAKNLNTQNDTFRQRLGNGLTYRIPRFQRDYSWTEDEWEDLWADILGTVRENGEPAHYMGYLVLQSENDKVFDVIDGQQRLTTLSLIVLAVLKNLQALVEAGKDAEENRKRAEQIRQTYIGYLDPVTLVTKSKLTLNRNNDSYYQNYIVSLRQLPTRKLKTSEGALRKAFDWFEKRVGEYAKAAIGQNEGVALASLVENMSDRLFFTVITVTDELNAYKVFETLNSRGVRLSATDLLKNYLFYVLAKGNHETEIRAAEDRWEEMVGKLGSESFPDFLRVHWNSRKAFVRQSELFKTIRETIRDTGDVFSLLRRMEEDMDAYLELTQVEPGMAEVGRQAAMLRMFNVRQPLSLLLAARRNLSEKDYLAVLQACVVISFRYNVIGNQPTHEQERVYNQVAFRISQGELANLQSILEALASVYPGDDVFRATFADKSMKTVQSRNKKVVRYILGEIEHHVSGAAFDTNRDTCSIEHILPENPPEVWEGFTDDNMEAFVYRLGNMTLLHETANRKGSNDSFEVKRQFFATSEFHLTKQLASDYTQWGPENIQRRQDWMARQATAIWRISQLS